MVKEAIWRKEDKDLLMHFYYHPVLGLIYNNYL